MAKVQMHERTGVPFAIVMAWIAVVIGIVYLGQALAEAVDGRNGINMVDCLLTGGPALILGCVILDRRRKPAPKAGDAPNVAAPIAPDND